MFIHILLHWFSYLLKTKANSLQRSNAIGGSNIASNAFWKKNFLIIIRFLAENKMH